MYQQTSFATLALALLLPAAGCGSTTAEPIGSGGSSSSATSTSSSGTGGDPGSSTSGSGGAAQGECAPACGSSEVCVESSCHALAKLDSTSQSTWCTIVLDTTHVYWATSEVRIVPKSGGEPTSFGAWVGQPSGLVVDDTYLYFNAGNGGIARGKKDGKSGFGPFSGQGFASPRHMMGDGAMLYYVAGATDQSGPSVYQTPTSGPPVDPTVFSSDTYGIGTVAVDATGVYYWAGSGLVKEEKITHARTELSSQGVGFELNVDDATGIVVDGATVYYSTAPVPGTGGVVAKVSGAGGESTIVVDSTSGASGVFAVDATSVYFMTVSGVMKVAKTGGAAVLLSALNPPSPFPTCMAVDDEYVYWVDGLDLMQYKK